MNGETDDWLKSNDSRDYFELLGFPTVGAEQGHLRDCVACATWLKKWLKGTGASAELIVPHQGTGNGERGTGRDPALSVPIVYGEIKGEEGATTVLLYGHYDVQPADPLDQWKTPPFKPTLKDGRIYCRGAQDDKGQFFAFLCGVRALTGGGTEADRQGGLRKLNVKIVLDGQEESGSSGLFRLLEDSSFRKKLRADVLLVCDTSAAADLRPAIVAGLRGINHFTVTLTAANRDLHSGEYGGIAPNAAQGIAELMASLHNPDGSIAVA